MARQNGDIVGQVILPPVILNEIELMKKMTYPTALWVIHSFANDAKRIDECAVLRGLGWWRTESTGPTAVIMAFMSHVLYFN